MRDIPRRLLLTGAAAAPFAGWTRQADAATPADTAVFAKQIDDIISLDPAECYEPSGVEIATNVYDRILRIDPENAARLLGGVAESWTVSADGKGFTFNLRRNLKFHSGAPVTAEDAAFSLHRVVLLDKVPAFLFTQLGWTSDTVKELVQATGPSTLSLTITADFAPSLVLNLLTSIVGSVVEKNLVLANESGGDLGNAWLKTHSAASGAYKLVAWKPSEQVELEGYAGFRLGAPRLKRVKLRHVAEPASQRQLLESGEVDFARNLQPEQVAALLGKPDITVEDFKAADIWYLGMNLGFEPFASAKVRTALKYLVDAQGMAEGLLAGRFTVQQSFLPVGLFGAIPYAPFRLDVPRAKSLLAEAGYPLGFEVKLSVPEGSPWTEIAQSVQHTLGQGGITVGIEQAELKTVLSTYRARRHELVLMSWGPDYFDPNSNADAFARNADNADRAKDKSLAWRNRWLIPELTARTLAASREPDTRQRAAMYADLQKQVTEEGPFILLFQTCSQLARRSRATGFTPGITADLAFYRSIHKS
jgi:peptide/nickel transport system substrate-binding protein